MLIWVDIAISINTPQMVRYMFKVANKTILNDSENSDNSADSDFFQIKKIKATARNLKYIVNILTK